MSSKKKSRLSIVILARGFVYVGRVTTDDAWCTIADAKNVRRWGTAAGLGELAMKGPLSATIFDDAGIVRAPLSAVIALIDCEEKAWNPRS